MRKKISTYCDVHWFERAVDRCQDCRRSVCVDCVVRIRRVGTFCVTCALARGGVRSVSRTRRTA
jgi:hypothetical protein